MYKCKHFKAHELVPQKIYSRYGEKSFQFLDDRLLMTLDFIREMFGETTINNYHWDGNREWSGLRTSDSPYYSSTSQHTFGRAADCIFNEPDVFDIQEYILTHQKNFPFIRGIETEVSWLHIDVGNRSGNTIQTFSK